MTEPLTHSTPGGQSGASRSRLHWFWRAAIAVVLGTVGGRLLIVPVSHVLVPLVFLGGPEGSDTLYLTISLQTVPAVLAVAIYGMLTARLGPSARP